MLTKHNDGGERNNQTWIICLGDIQNGIYFTLFDCMLNEEIIIPKL
jgi:hypothetical protein